MLQLLEKKIGRDKFQRLLQKILPSCEQDYAIIRVQLQQHNWEQATQQAHSLKSTARLFSCWELADSLELVEQKNIALIRLPSFQEQLENQYQDFLSAIYQQLE